MDYLVTTSRHPAAARDCVPAFTPDEEIGRDPFRYLKFGADWAYTMDGGEIGELEY